MPRPPAHRRVAAAAAVASAIALAATPSPSTTPGLLGATTFAACGLPIPNSGGAQQRPSGSLASDAPDVVGPGLLTPRDITNWAGPYLDEGESGPTVRTAFCGGHGVCERACCEDDACAGWGWTVGGSVHSPCAAQACQLLLTPQPPEAWGGLLARVPLVGGYNVHGFLFVNGTSSKSACCRAPVTAPPAATPGSATGSASPSASAAAASDSPLPSPSAAASVGSGCGGVWFPR